MMWKALWIFLVTNDAFGLETKGLFLNVERGAYMFNTNSQKLQVFRKWLNEQMEQGLLSVEAMGDPWTVYYIDSAYKKGIEHAFIEAKRKMMIRAGTPSVGHQGFSGMKAMFLMQAFAAPERLSKVRFLATRAYEELRGVSATMAQQLNRALADGLTKGQSPRHIARLMAKSIDGLTKSRALLIARTEIIAAHAEGQLDAFQQLGVEKIKLYAEWSTAGDDKVCAECGANEGKQFTIEEARGQIPKHPNCRCAWLPVEKGLRG